MFLEKQYSMLLKSRVSRIAFMDFTTNFMDFTTNFLHDIGKITEPLCDSVSSALKFR